MNDPCSGCNGSAKCCCNCKAHGWHRGKPYGTSRNKIEPYIETKVDKKAFRNPVIFMGWYDEYVLNERVKMA